MPDSPATGKESMWGESKQSHEKHSLSHFPYHQHQLPQLIAKTEVKAKNETKPRQKVSFEIIYPAIPDYSLVVGHLLPFHHVDEFYQLL